MTSNTVAFTGLSTDEGEGYNLIPGMASIKVDIRWLSTHKPEVEIEKIKTLAQKFGIEIKLHEVFSGMGSPIDTQFVDLIKQVAISNEPDAVLAPLLTPGATDSRFFREIGFECYGFIPILVTMNDLEGYHGPNESLSLENLHRGTNILTEITLSWATH
jgi:acetylornithine deacetylase/succinyl-diaminopimelate desuccinylase-like protein